MLAEWTGLEPATPGVTGRYSNQLNYHSLIYELSLAYSNAICEPICFFHQDPYAIHFRWKCDIEDNFTSSALQDFIGWALRLSRYKYEF